MVTETSAVSKSKDPIISKLNKLIDAGKSKHANPGAIVKIGDEYQVKLGETMGTYSDIIRVHKYLAEAGLVDGSRQPEVGDYGITTSKGHITLGYGDGKGGFIDNVQLSDNVRGTSKLGEGFGMAIGFGDREPKEIGHKLDEAIRLQKLDLDRAQDAEKGSNNHVSRIKDLDQMRDHEAGFSSLKRRRSTEDNVAIVQKFVADIVKDVAPGLPVKVTYDASESASVKYVYDLSKPTFKIELPVDKIAGDPWEVADKITARIQEKFPNKQKLPVSGIRSKQDTVMVGEIFGSPERLAAQIEGTLGGVVSR